MALLEIMASGVNMHFFSAEKAFKQWFAVCVPTRSIARATLSLVMLRISATISSSVFPLREMAWWAPSGWAGDWVFDDVMAMTFRLQRVAIWIANCSVTIEPPQRRRYSAVEDESWGAAGAIGASSHGLKVIAAVKPATPRQAAESKDRFKGRDRTVCAGPVTYCWKQPKRRSL